MQENPFDAIPDIDFAPKSVDQILREMTAAYENEYEKITGERAALEPATKERIFINTQATQIYAIYQMIDYACKMNLLKYSTGKYLDNLAAWVGETRLPAQHAVTKLRFALSAKMDRAILIPSGTRATSPNKVYFQTTADLIIPAGEMQGECAAVSCDTGVKTSGLQLGEINTIVDPAPYAASVTNIEVSQGGADAESDNSLRLRVFLKPKSLSTAGPKEAYEYFVRSHSQAIEDVRVMTPAPAVVDIRITLEGGALPTESFLGEVHAALDGKRPATDRLLIAPPDIVEYTLKCTYYVAKSNPGKLDLTIANINNAGQKYLAWQSARIGRDLSPDKLRALLIDAGAKRLEVESPAYSPISDTAICKCKSGEIIFGGVEDD